MKFRSLSCLLLVLILSNACGRIQGRRATATTIPASRTALSTGSIEATLTIGDTTRHYRLYVPGSYTGETATALVINLHGFGSDSKEEEALSGMSLAADRDGYSAAYPDGLNKEWKDGSGSESQADIQFIVNLIHKLESLYNIDAKRVYATGISNGGGMANRLACEQAGIFAAIGPVSGAYNFWKDCAPSRPVPVIAFHGTSDNIVPYDGVKRDNIIPNIPEWAAAWAQRNQCSPTPSTTYLKPDVKVDNWENCQAAAEVVLYSIDNHGHSWPGSRFLKGITSQSVDATQVMWDFFKEHPMP